MLYEVITEAKLYKAMSDDLNSPILIANLFDGVKNINSILAGNQSISADDLEELKRLMNLFIFDILGLSKPETSAENNENDKMDDVMQLLLKLRAEAKSNKDWSYNFV